ncbi:Integrase catalytic core protein [Phytophthora palmivora]|uniref:Integrase catalytic core protein n=1 Tax=Phytophthora palmivora TaxID=4796 RepID=A0A2P4XNP3_9STRA|nr:Integrase catalytic core protein [Phytophthora palmivora]
MEAWNTLRKYYNRTTLHNRVAMTRRLHEFKMEEGTPTAKHLDAFVELVVGLQTLGDPVDEARQLVFKEKLLKEHERLLKKETTEKAFRANGNAGRFKGGRGNGRKGNSPKKNGGFKVKCFKCDQVGQMKRDSPSKNDGVDNDAVFSVGEGRLSGWLIDSGATSHMTPFREDLFDLEGTVSSIEVTIADGKKLRVAGQGTVRLTSLNGKHIKMMEVLYIPGLDRRLLSVGKLAERGLTEKKIGKANMLDCEQEEAQFVEYAGTGSQWELWHARMGHPSENAMINTQRITNGTPTVGRGIKTLCGGCMKGKQTVSPFPSRSERKTSRVLELVHTDVMGPMKTVYKGGSRYALTFVDDFSKFVVAYFLKSKSEVVAKLAECRAFYENQFGERLKWLRSDIGTEFVNKKVAALCNRNGIVHQRTVPYSPQQNGVAERMNRTIMEKVRSMLYYKGVSTVWWAEAVSTAVYLINRSSNTTHLDATPYEVCFKMKPRLAHLRVFGSLGYGHIDDVKRTKLESKSFRCMFLGYAENAKGYRVYDLEASKAKVSRSVELDEREVGGIYDTPSSQHHGAVIHVTKDGDEGTVPVDEEHQSAADERMDVAEILDVEMGDVEPEMNVEEVMQLPPPERSGSTGLEITPYHPQPEAYQEVRLVFHPESERSRRSHEPVFLLENGQNDGEESRSEGSDGPPSPKLARIDEDGLIAEAVMAYVANIIEVTDVPTTYAEAMASHEADEWRKAMNAELYSHEKNTTWTLVPRGPDKRTIGCRWVFAKKRDENGRVTRYKARLVAKGFKQKYGIYFFETYSPVANMNSIRVVLAVCVAFDYIMEQLEADAFLNSGLSDIVYMQIPHGVKIAKGMVCKLLKAIYGLKQAASAWNKTIHRLFLQNGFKSCGADQCVYVKRTKDGFVYVCLYVDDMIIAAKTVGEISEVKDTLNNAFKMKELGTAKFILGMEIDHDRNASTLMIKQTRYIDDVAERFGQKNAKPVDNPCSSNLKLSKAQSPGTVEERIEMQSKPYRSLIGCLLYITTCTRPDIAYIVTQLSRFLENPGLQHWRAAIRVLRYLKTTREHGILYNGGKNGLKVEAFSDADWGSYIDDRRSVWGIMVMIGNAPVVFKSKFQRTVALSSAEAEYMALSLCVQEVLWLRAMLKDMGIQKEGTTRIW